MERVFTRTPHDRAGVTRDVAVRTAAVKRVSTDATSVVTGIPGPRCDEANLVND